MPNPFIEVAKSSSTIAHATDPGRTGKNNEDNYALFESIQQGTDGPSDQSPLLVAVIADGIGGSASGEVASQLAIDTFVAEFKRGVSLNVPERLELSIRSANQAIFSAGRLQPETKGMGTTVVAAVVVKDFVYIAHAGDSRAYLIRKGQIYQLTLDHSWVQEAIDASLITVERASRHPNRHVIKRFLGPLESVEVDHQILEVANREHDIRLLQYRRYAEGDRLQLLPGDTLLLCSDGLNDAIPDQKILEIVLQHPPQQAVRELIRAANDAGGPDNITALLLQHPWQLAPTADATTIVTGPEEKEDKTERWQLVPGAESSPTRKQVAKRKAGPATVAILLVVVLLLIGAGIVVWGESLQQLALGDPVSTSKLDGALSTVPIAETEEATQETNEGATPASAKDLGDVAAILEKELGAEEIGTSTAATSTSATSNSAMLAASTETNVETNGDGRPQPQSFALTTAPLYIPPVDCEMDNEPKGQLHAGTFITYTISCINVSQANVHDLAIVTILPDNIDPHKGSEHHKIWPVEPLLSPELSEPLPYRLYAIWPATNEAVNDPAVLTLIKSAPSSMGAGGILTYTLVAENQGRESIQGTWIISDQLPVGVTAADVITSSLGLATAEFYDRPILTAHVDQYGETIRQWTIPDFTLDADQAITTTVVLHAGEDQLPTDDFGLQLLESAGMASTRPSLVARLSVQYRNPSEE